MKKSLAVLTTLLLIGTASTNVFASQSNTDLQNPEKVIRGFFDAEKSGNIDSMELYAKDLRFNDEATQRANYQRDYQEHPLLNYKILSKNQVDDSHVQYMVHLDFKDMDQLPNLQYTVEKANGTWKVIIQEIDIDANKNSTTYGKVTRPELKAQKIDTSAPPSIHPNTTTAVYYNFNNLYYNEYTDSNPFSQTRTDGQFTLNGWQEADYGPDMWYYVLKTSGGVTTVYDHVEVNATYPQYGTWYTKYMYNVPYTSGLILRSWNQGNAIATGAGNGYE